MGSATRNPFSLQPWSRNDTDEGALKDVLARVNLERGHFRDISEASLQEEIAGEGALELSESETDNEDSEDDGDRTHAIDSKSTTREDLVRAKYDMEAAVKAAEQEVMKSLDFISLLLSKDAPKQAHSSISPALNAAAPLGSLGTDIWQRMPVDRARAAQDDLLATNVRIQGLQQSADSLLSAATRLQSNVRKETQYWSQILSIAEEGWNVCRIPGQQHRLGVSFGFSESAPAFSRRGIAELNAGPGGNIMLERAIGSRPRGLRATLRKKNIAIGTSKLPRVPDQGETTLEARIRHARDSLFDEELYYEMIRESRSISSLGVGLKGSAIEVELKGASRSGITISLDLVTLDHGDGLSNADLPEQDDPLAHAIVLAARLFLSQAHRDRLKKRSEMPPPMSEKQKEENPVLPILRPIMAFFLHNSELERVNAYLATVTKMLRAAAIESSKQAATLHSSRSMDVTNTEALVTMLLQPWNSNGHVSFRTPQGSEISLGIRTETTLAHGSFSSVFTLRGLLDTELYRFDTVDEIIEAADTRLASALAKALASLMDHEWRCNEREALVERDRGVGEKSQSLWVTVDSHMEMVSLHASVKKMMWKLDGNSSQDTFWEAMKAVFQQE